MTVLAQLLIAAALVAAAVIYGTDVFAAIVLRPALAHVDDRTLTSTTGYMYDYADRRLPVPGAIGLAATVWARPWRPWPGTPAPPSPVARRCSPWPSGC